MARHEGELDAELARLRAERAELAAALEQARRYEAAVAAATQGVMCVDAEKGRYAFVNGAFARMVGRPLDEVMAADPYQIWIEVTHPEDIDAERAALARIAKGEIDRFELHKRLIARGEEPRWMHVQVVATREANGRLQGITGFFTDVHEQRTATAARERLENQLRQAQKLDALGKLAGGVAHDFNNRLLIIIGYTELLRHELPPDSEMARNADLVLASAQRGAELTRQLLAYSRRQVLKPEAFDLNRSVDQMLCLLGRLIGDQVEVVTSLGATSFVFSDPGQIEQVILNLALNARDAMPRGGRLALETSDVVLNADPVLPAGDYVTLTVADSGDGIPDDVLPHIFEPFFTTKAVGQGTGLGLSMVEGIVHQSGGAVRVTTRPGEGTRFVIYLPRAARVPEQRYTVVPAAPREINFETVLVCDDDDDVRKLLVDVLGLRAYCILQARNGRDALEIAGRHDGPIHLLVTDVVMPELGGVELAGELRKRDPALRVLFVSGYADDAGVLSEPLAADTRFLAKPFLPGDLTRAVFSMLERRPD
jgi:two-component system cell cycle sensor histidine kinase/response regulator CckA